ncbi:MAG: DUF397 domain-containing protein [Streptomyces sp.]|uniref:DUF397 domain-containing protein n=1 Tax=Streptomyces sp. TaxID=1931 RepID=UPI003D6A40A9
MNIEVVTDSAAQLAWFKSSYSGAEGGDCIEVAATPRTIHVRDSKDREGPILSVAPAGWAAFVGFAAQD